MTFAADFEHRDELLTAAIDEFCRNGYDAASLNRILTAATMSKGQLYHHFAGKEGLYVALVEWAINERNNWLVGHPPEPADDFFDNLRNQLLAGVAFTASRPDVQRFVRSLLAERGRAIFDVVTERVGFTGESPLAALVAAHHEQGGFRPGLSLELATRAVLLVVNQAPELLDLTEAGDLAIQVDELIDFLRHGLAKQPKP